MPGNTAFANGHGHTHSAVLHITGYLLNRSLNSSALVVNADKHCRFGGGNVSIFLRSLGQLGHSGSLGGGMLTFIGIPD